MVIDHSDHSHLDSGDNPSNSEDSSLPTHNPGDISLTSNSSPPASPAIPTDASPVRDSSTRQTHSHPDSGDNPSNSDDSSLPTHNPGDISLTSNSSPPASPAIPTNASPVSDSSTRVPAIHTVQTYLSHQAQAIQSHLTTILPSLIQGEVRTQYSQLAEEIGVQISSIREEFNRHTGDQDDPMLPSSEEGENRGSSRHGGRSRRNHHRSQQPNNGDEADGDEADEEDEGDENENEISAGTRKYKKQVQALRVSIHSCSP
jgi:hypothetical protein